MCRMFKCLPSELRKEDAEDIEAFSIVYEILMKDNPFFAFM